MKNRLPQTGKALVYALLFAPLISVHAQEAAEEEEEIFELSPFTVDGSEDSGYRATHTLAGTRIRTELKDVGSSISVVTDQFLKDTGATDNQSLLKYTTATEVGGVDGNFAGAGNGVTVNESFQNPSTNTRVRGLASADNTRNFFLTNIPWDGYIVDRVDLQRGPNSILFGFGSPAGIINTSVIRPHYENEGEIEFRIDEQGSFRTRIDLNRVVLEDQLSVRIAGVNEEIKFRQDPAFEHDRRYFIGVKYEPKFLKSDSANTVIDAYYENGDINANRPRSITPRDHITAWFRPVHNDPEVGFASGFNPLGGIGQGTFSPVQLEDNSGVPNVGQNRENYADGSVNPFFIPALGNFGQSFGGPLAFVTDANTGVIDLSLQSEWRPVNGLAPDGSVDGTVTLPFQRLGSIGAFSSFARRADLPFADFGQYKDITLSDQSIFDFYNHLIDGPNKSEEQLWDNYNASLTQTFLNNKLGFEIAYDKQDYFETQTSLITDTRQSIFIDLNESLPDGSANPNVGRPFISDSGQFGNNLRDTERESTRVTIFAEHDFRDYGKENFFTRLLGAQRFTGLHAEDQLDTRSVGWQRFTLGQSFRDYFGVPDIGDNINAYNPAIYLGPSLIGRDSAAGAGIPGIKAQIQIPNEVDVRFWDSTWVAEGVNPGDPWTTDTGGSSTQSENPANYRGWTVQSFPLETADASNPTPLATGGFVSRQNIESDALVLQNYFLNGAIVGTYGWREDTGEAVSDQAVLDSVTQRALVEQLDLANSDPRIFTDQTRSWSVAAHLNELGLDSILPVNISLYYNEGENFQPAADRTDLFGRSLTPPRGETVDRSVLIASKNGRYSLRATRFTTSLVNSTGSRISGDWFLGTVQAWGQNWRNIFALDNDNGVFGNPTGENTFGPFPGQTQAEADALEAAAIADWDKHIQNVRDLSEELTGNPEAFFENFQIDLSNTAKNGISASGPSTLAFTEDSRSEGWEFEFTANPTDNWNISFNAAKVDAIRTNVGGEALLRYVALVNEDLNNTNAGDLRLWWGGAGSPTFLQEWNSTFNSNFNLTKLLEGTSTPELREWRFNMVTNYSFRDGALQGLNVGGAYRWQDDVVIGFPPSYTDETQTDVTFDLDNPYRGPSESNVDLWVGYGKQLSDRVHWRIQFNLRNAFADKDLIPINTQADGTVAAWRLGAARSWSLSNTFSF